jgi:hypothetical protein
LKERRLSRLLVLSAAVAVAAAAAALARRLVHDGVAKGGLVLVSCLFCLFFSFLFI